MPLFVRAYTDLLSLCTVAGGDNLEVEKSRKNLLKSEIIDKLWKYAEIEIPPSHFLRPFKK